MDYHVFIAILTRVHVVETGSVHYLVNDGALRNVLFGLINGDYLSSPIARFAQRCPKPVSIFGDKLDIICFICSGY